MEKIVVKLFIAGHTSSSERAVSSLHRICDSDPDHDFEISVIDVLEQPQLAEEARILATPTLIKELPLPVRRLIGDLSDEEKVLVGLDVQIDNMTDRNKNE